MRRADDGRLAAAALATGRRLWAFRLTAFAVAIVVALVMLEGAVRVRQWFRFGSSNQLPYGSQMDPRLRAPVPVPGERTRNLRINSLGFRGPDLAVGKAPGVIRIAFLGASTTFCAEVSSNEAAWPHIVVEALRREWPGRQFDYVNGAFPGYTVETSHRNLLVRVAPLNPDIIVIYEGFNDVSFDTRAAAKAAGISRGAVDERTGLARYSLMVFLIQKNLQILTRQRNADSGPKLAFDPQLSTRFHDAFRALVADAQQVAPVVAVATLSQKVRRDQSAEQQRRNASTHLYYMPQLTLDGVLAAFTEYNRVIREVARESHAVLIDDEDAIPADDAHFADSIHLTDVGSQAMADRVARVLRHDDAIGRLVHGQAGAVGTVRASTAFTKEPNP